MDDKIKKHYLSFGTYTFPGLYQEKLKNDLPDDIREIGLLVRKNFIHRTTLSAGNTGTNADLKFGDMTKVPWWRQPEDDILVTTGAMLAELYRRDERGFVNDRQTKDKLVLTCRFVAIMIASILKSKGIPARVRSGNAPYFDMGELGNISTDHWINQYWSEQENRWITIDVDGSLSLKEKFDPYDIPNGKFDFPADAWLGIRAGKLDPQHFYNAGGVRGAIVILWSLFYDFHSLMNNEIIYIYGPAGGYGGAEKFNKLTKEELEKIDNLARLMQKPDENFDELVSVWESEKDFRLLVGGLL
ncbi:MAG: transglutaminase domain-containing protein [Candidatus Saccharimonadaceae bacterium]|nr:transglutaminase domain-containing protein [Candidatus Saccharimonadaceae bacterium]